MNQFLQLLVYGCVTGLTYALLSASFWLIYATTRTFHLAHSLIYTTGAYAALVAVQAGLPLALAAVFALIVPAGLGMLMDAAVYAPLRRRGTTVLGIFLASLGVATAGASILQLIFGGDVRQVSGFPNATMDFGAFTITRIQLSGAVSSLVVITAVWLLLARSKVGHAISAVRNNAELASCVGIPAKRISAFVFALGSAMAGLAAFWESVNFVAFPTMGLQPIMYAVIGVFLGGISSLGGAAVGGFLLGFLLVFSGLFLSQNLGVILVFALLALIIVFRPEGILRGNANA